MEGGEHGAYNGAIVCCHIPIEEQEEEEERWGKMGWKKNGGCRVGGQQETKEKEMGDNKRDRRRLHER